MDQSVRNRIMTFGWRAQAFSLKGSGGQKAMHTKTAIEMLAIRIKETVAELRDVQTPVAAVNRAEE